MLSLARVSSRRGVSKVWEVEAILKYSMARGVDSLVDDDIDYDSSGIEIHCSLPQKLFLHLSTLLRLLCAYSRLMARLRSSVFQKTAQSLLLRQRTQPGPHERPVIVSSMPRSLLVRFCKLHGIPHGSSQRCLLCYHLFPNFE